MTLSFRRRAAAAALAAPLLLSAAFAFAQGAPEPRAVSVNQLADMGAIRLEGRVAEIFGNRFVLEDATGRTLVETGPRGDRSALVAVGDTVVVEGGFERGEVRAQAITVGGGERVALERPRPERDGPRGPGRDGPRHGGPGRDGPPRGQERGGWFGRGIDETAAAKVLTDAGYTDVTLVEAKRRHAEFTARDASGAAWDVTVNDRNEVAEREPFAEPITKAAAREAIEGLGYTWRGGFEAKRHHAEADATDAAGRELRVEVNRDGSLRKEKLDD